MKRFIFLSLLAAACGADDPHCRTSFDCPTTTFCLAGTCTTFESDISATNPLEPTDSGVPDRSREPADPDTWVLPAPLPQPSMDAGNVDDLSVDSAPSGHPCLSASAPDAGDLRITEVLSDPPAGMDGDSNNDGLRNAYEDEFIEIINTTEHALDLESVHVFVGEQYKFGFEEFCLQPKDAVILFSRGSPNMPGPLNVLTTDTRLSLSNSGGSVHILRNEFVLDTFVFPGSSKGSWVRWPEPSGSEIVRHWDIRLHPFSPGYCSNQGLFGDDCVVEEILEDADAGAD